MFLHIGWLHLLWNAYASFGVCTRVEQTLGAARFLVVYLLAGIAGGAASTVLPYAVSAGASGAMFGMVGATLALRRAALPSFAAAWADPPTRAIVANIAIWTVIGVTAMPMNNRAHLGGLVAGALATWIFTAQRRTSLWIVYGTAFSGLLVLATRPWSAPVAPPSEPPIEDALLARCERGETAACHAITLTLPPSPGDMTSAFDPMCQLGDADACAALGWMLAHGRPGILTDEPRGAELLGTACQAGSAWGCAMAKGIPPREALQGLAPRPAAVPPDGGAAARCEATRGRDMETVAPFLERVVATLVAGSSARTRIGTFELTSFRAYEGRNPRTGAVVPVPARRVPGFTPSEELATRLRSSHTPAETDGEAPILPAIDVACTDADVDAVARMLADCGALEVTALGTLRAFERTDGTRSIMLRTSPDAVDAMNARGPAPPSGAPAPARPGLAPAR